MASGKKNYFRHSFFARDDLKLRMLRDEIGTGFYFFYFSLLELCGTQCEDKAKTYFEFHESQIRQLWDIKPARCQYYATAMDACCLLKFKKAGKTFQFTIDNFPKFLGKYQNKNKTKTPNKRKENKIKENKIKKPKKQDFDLEEIGKNWFRKGACKLGIKHLEEEIKTIEQFNSFKRAAETYKQIQIEKDESFEYALGFNKFAECWEQWANIKSLEQTQAELIQKLERDELELIKNEGL